ncbi:glycerophosphodiester phosphodiesterase [uncultured Vibrio sp.]|uniref:glycerophosphodiester phosphodiesterase n=1 Tax=uncultured Vibrio sp. TaxID=114054 RepID=UPI0025D217BB|nr:glycerophosphodiester phosphodiesterase [uncultured Vibrio sp.]
MRHLSRISTPFLKLVGIAIIGVVQGCATTPTSTSSGQGSYVLEHGLGLPNDAKLISNSNTPEGRAVFRDMQLAYKSRNLYLTIGGDLSYIKGQCPIDVVAHRGSSNYAENSRDAIKMGGVGGFDGVEIDVMLTRDKHWVVHHDIETGRATARSDGKKYRVSRMNANEWNSLSGRNPDGTLNGYRPAYFDEAANDWLHHAVASQHLNIEIKTSDGSMTDLHKLDAIAKQNLPYGNYFYSSMDMDVLKKMREINPSVYLGYVWEPHPASIAQFKRDAKRGMNSDDYYNDNQKTIDKAFAMEGRYRKTKPKHSAKTVKTILGANSGLHVDIRSYRQHATIQSRAKSQGLKVVTYTINGTEYHQSQLNAIHKQRRALPDEAIMDTSKLSICQQLNPQLITQSEGYSPTTIAGDAIVRLPNDADFQKLYEQFSYLQDDHYITHRGEIRLLQTAKTSPSVPLNHSVNKESKEPKVTRSANTAAVFEIEDEDFDLSTEAISISMPVE